MTSNECGVRRQSTVRDSHADRDAYCGVSAVEPTTSATVWASVQDLEDAVATFSR